MQLEAEGAPDLKEDRQACCTAVLHGGLPRDRRLTNDSNVDVNVFTMNIVGDET